MGERIDLAGAEIRITPLDTDGNAPGLESVSKREAARRAHELAATELRRAGRNVIGPLAGEPDRVRREWDRLVDRIARGGV